MSALKRACRPCPPLRRFTFTSPLVRSPYSTPGIPRTTSTCSTSSVDMERISTPELVKSRLVVLLSHAPLACCISAFVDIGAPSITKLVPSDDVLYFPVGRPVSRSFIMLGEVRFGSLAIPPGSSSIRSLMLDGCRCFMACFPITDDEVSPRRSVAVTTTSFSIVVDGVRRYVALFLSLSFSSL